MEGGVRRGTLGVVVEAKLEDVLDVVGVARDCREALLPGEEGDGADACAVRTATSTEIVRQPIVHAVGVLEEAWEVTQ